MAHPRFSSFIRSNPTFTGSVNGARFTSGVPSGHASLPSAALVAGPGLGFAPGGTSIPQFPTFAPQGGPTGFAGLCALIPDPTIRAACEAGVGLFGGGNGGPGSGFAPQTCVPPFFRNAAGECELDVVPGPGGGGVGARRDVGAAVVGRFGVALEPGVQQITRRICLEGMQLGKDGLCYNKGILTNRQREWPRARRPLLTGGERNAITKAAAAGRKLERASKQLQSIGLMKKPAARRTQVHRGVTRAALPPGTTIVQN